MTGHLLDLLSELAEGDNLDVAHEELRHGATVAGKDIRQAVYISVYLEVNARLQKQAMDMGEIKFLTAGEVDKVSGRTGSYGINRAWENWCRRAGRPFQADAGRG